MHKFCSFDICSLSKVQAARNEMQWGEEGPPPLLVKIAPDLSKEDLEDIAAVCACASRSVASSAFNFICFLISFYIFPDYVFPSLCL